MPRIKILPLVDAGSPGPIHLNINGVEKSLDVGVEITVTDDEFLALGHSDHVIELQIEGNTAAVDEEQTSAPAGSGDGGEVGGGATGDAAAATSGEAQADPALVTSNDEAAASVPQPEIEPMTPPPGEQTSDLELQPSEEVQAPAEAAPEAEVASGDDVSAELPAAPEAQPEVEEAPVEEPVADVQPEVAPAAAAELTPIEKLEQAEKLEQEAIAELKDEQNGSAA